MKEQRFFYGWIIVAVSFTTLAISFGIWYSFSVFFVAVLNEFGWSRASAAGVFSLFMIIHSGAAVFMGYFLDRFGPRFVIPLGSLLTVVGLFATSLIHNLWQFYLFYGVVTAMGICSTGFISHSIFLPKWFFKKRGLALGIATAGIGVGMQVIVPAIQYIIDGIGWRNAYCILAIIVLSVIIPLNALLQRRSPAEIGILPNGQLKSLSPKESTGETGPSSITENLSSTNWTLGNTIETWHFWILLIIYFLTPMVTQGPLIHQVAYVVDKGFSAQKGAFFFGLTGITGSLGKILFGFYSDKVGREKALSYGMGLAFLGIISLMSLQKDYEAMLYGYAILFGLGYGSVAPIYPARAADLFHGPQFGRIYSLLAIAGGFGGGLGIWLYGKIFDLTSSYLISFIIALITLIIIVIVFRFTSPFSLQGKIKGHQKFPF